MREACAEEVSLKGALLASSEGVLTESARSTDLALESLVELSDSIQETYPARLEELNVEKISLEEDLDRFQKVEIQPNRKALGKKVRQELPQVLHALDELDDHEATLAVIQAGRMSIAGFTITEDDVVVRRVERMGYSAMTIEVGENEVTIDVSIVLDMSIDDALLSKGLAREIIRRIQSKRKELDLEMESTIELEIWLSEECPELVEYDWEHVKAETRARTASLHEGEGPSNANFFEVDGANISFKVN